MTRSTLLKLIVTPLVEGGLLLATLRIYGWQAMLILLVWLPTGSLCPAPNNCASTTLNGSALPITPR